MSVLTFQSLLFMTIGSLCGLLIGFLPGLGGIVSMALLLPFALGYEPVAILSLLLGAHIGTIWGGTVTAILFKVPGSGKNLASVFDGYPMAQNGEATQALSASAVASLMGGIVGAIFLAISIPFVRPIIFALGPSEYLMMALWGLTIIASFSGGSVVKGLIAACFGILFAFVGKDPVTATPRYTFGMDSLLEGFSFPVAMIGMFAILEMLKLFVQQTPISSSLGEARVVIEGWRRHYNAVRPHSSLGYRPPAPEAVAPSARPPAQPRPAPAGALTMETRPQMN
jgi:TctA family transporter